MRISILFLSFLAAALLSPSDIRAQSREPMLVRGQVTADSLPAAGAAIILNAFLPNAAHRTMLADEAGNFQFFTDISRPEITIVYMGFKPFTRLLEEPADTIELGIIRLAPDPLQADEIVVSRKLPVAEIRGDTLQFNAGAFKTNPDATSEDLLRKMPGITVDAGGQLSAQGEKIQRVYVDGKDFFSEDPQTALRNLPAYTVKNIQLYDDKSEEAKFSGIEDGKRIKTVNVVTKTGVNHSTFGKLQGGYGTQGRYAAGWNANLFRGDHRFTATGQLSNVRDPGYGGGMRGGYGGQAGENTHRSAGVNYTGLVREKLKISSNYQFNQHISGTHSNTANEYLAISRSSTEESHARTRNYDNYGAASLEWNPDSLNRFFFRPRFGFSNGNGEQFTQQLVTIDQIPSTRSADRYRNHNRSYNLSGDVSWMRRLRKKGRTLTATASLFRTDNKRTTYQHSLYGSSVTALNGRSDTIQQRRIYQNPSSGVEARFNYSEPLTKEMFLNGGYSVRYQNHESDQQGWNWDDALRYYSDPDELATRRFDQRNITHNMHVGYSFHRKGWMLNLTANYENTLLRDKETYPRDSRHSYRFQSLLPHMRATYRFNDQRSVHLYFNRYTQLPSVQDLRDVIDVTNPLFVTRGNPGLKAGYANSVGANYNFYHPSKQYGFAANLG